MRLPGVPRPTSSSGEKFALSVWDTLEVITGRRGRISKLASTATTAEIITKINELIDRLQGD